MKSVIKTLLLLPALALSGCAVNSYCEGEQKYEQAKTLPPLRSVEGAQVPESPSALKIPPPPEQPVPFGQVAKDEDGDDMISCLDKPPEMAAPKPLPEEPASKPAATAPAEPKPAETAPQS